MIFIQAGIELYPRDQLTHDFEIMMLLCLVVDRILPQVLNLVADKHRQFNFLFDIVCKILHPQHGDCVWFHSNAEDTQRPARLTNLKHDGRLVPRVNWKTEHVHLPRDGMPLDFCLLFG